MRTSQWLILGIALLLLGIWFIKIDAFWNDLCEKNLYVDSGPVVPEQLVACINAEIYDPFIWILHILGFAVMICAAIEAYGVYMTTYSYSCGECGKVFPDKTAALIHADKCKGKKK